MWIKFCTCGLNKLDQKSKKELLSLLFLPKSQYSTYIYKCDMILYVSLSCKVALQCVWCEWHSLILTQYLEAVRSYSHSEEANSVGVSVMLQCRRKQRITVEPCIKSGPCRWLSSQKQNTNALTVSAVMDSHYRLASSLNDIASYKYWLSCCLLEGKHILFFFQSSPVFSPVQCYGKFSWLDRFFKACNQVGVERTGSCFYGQDLTRASAVLKDTWHLEERRRSLRNDSVNRVTSLTPNKILMRLLNNVACTRWG